MFNSYPDRVRPKPSLDSGQKSEMDLFKIRLLCRRVTRGSGGDGKLVQLDRSRTFVPSPMEEVRPPSSMTGISLEQVLSGHVVGAV